jgi:hypothetical protein
MFFFMYEAEGWFFILTITTSSRIISRDSQIHVRCYDATLKLHKLLLTKCGEISANLDQYKYIVQDPCSTNYYR